LDDNSPVPRKYQDHRLGVWVGWTGNKTTYTFISLALIPPLLLFLLRLSPEKLAKSLPQQALYIITIMSLMIPGPGALITADYLHMAPIQQCTVANDSGMLQIKFKNMHSNYNTFCITYSTAS
jgi:hypothetical protein